MDGIREIIGNTTATPNPQPDWAQTDGTKADYIKNKPTLLTEENVIEIIGEHGSASQLPETSEDDNGKIVEIVDGEYVLKDIASSSVGAYVQAVVDGTLDEIDDLIGGEDADEGSEGG